MSAPTVTVVVPVRDGERYLADALDSVVAQTRPPAEVIVVDDGSRDASGSIAVGYTPLVRLVRQRQAGAPAARNRGVSLARGSLIAFLDADDLWEPHKLDLQLAAFEADPSLDVVFGHMRQFLSPELSEADAARLHCPDGLDPGCVLGASMMRRELLERVGPLREDLVVGEFVDWIARARDAAAREAMLPDHVLWRRIHGSNHTLRHRAARGDVARLLKASLDRRRAAAAGADA